MSENEKKEKKKKKKKQWKNIRQRNKEVMDQIEEAGRRPAQSSDRYFEDTD